MWRWIVLKPEIPIEDSFEKLWTKNKLRIKQPLTDEELRIGKKVAWEKHVSKKIDRWRKQGI